MTTETHQSHPGRSSFDYTLLISMLLVCITLVLIGVIPFKEASNADRYQLVQAASGGIVARLDKKNGEIVFVSVSGNEVASYPNAADILSRVRK
jgi:hypothetical protein